MASKPKRIRDYAKEYVIRIARGLAGGKSRSQARGHARAVDLPSSTSSQPFKRSEPLEDALKLMKKGVSQKEGVIFFKCMNGFLQRAAAGAIDDGVSR